MPGPYELYLIRHGLAEERGDAWPDDSKRPLTEQGMSRLRKSARGLARAGVAFGKILHPSPANPAANRDWSGAAASQLRTLGVW